MQSGKNNHQNTQLLLMLLERLRREQAPQTAEWAQRRNTPIAKGQPSLSEVSELQRMVDRIDQLPQLLAKITQTSVFLAQRQEKKRLDMVLTEAVRRGLLETRGHQMYSLSPEGERWLERKRRQLGKLFLRRLPPEQRPAAVQSPALLAQEAVRAGFPADLVELIRPQD